MKILVDASVWVDHLRRSHAGLRSLLEDDLVVTHPFVVGELVLGGLSEIAGRGLQHLESVEEVTHEEALHFVEMNNIAGRGIGWVDTHLLATSLIGRCRLWTKDRSLAAVAQDLHIAYQP